MNILLMSLAVVAFIVSLLPTLSFSLPTSLSHNVVAESKQGGVYRVPRSLGGLGGGDVPKLVILDIVVFEGPKFKKHANDPPVFTPGSVTPSMPASGLMPIGPIRFTPFNKVGARALGRRGLALHMETSLISRRQTNDANTKPSSNSGPNAQEKKAASNDNVTSKIFGTNGAASSAPGPVKDTLGSTTDGIPKTVKGVVGGGASREGVRVPSEIIGRVKLPKGIVRRGTPVPVLGGVASSRELLMGTA